MGMKDGGPARMASMMQPRPALGSMMASMPGGSAPAPLTMPAPLMPTPGLAPRERFQMAVNLLNQGDAAHAEVELKEYIAEVPNSGPAKMMLAQIETPLDMLYPAENFTVQLQPNEALSTLAQRYLGDSQQFYGLARYNGIPNPSRLIAGQMIKIPATAMAIAVRDGTAMPPMQQAMVTPPPPPAAAPTRPPAAPARGRVDPWPAIRDAVMAGRFEEAVKTAEAARVTPNRAEAPILAAAYSGNAKALRASNPNEAEMEAVRAGRLYLETADRPEEAVEPLQLAVEINPGNMRAAMLLATAKTRAADVYYRNGVQAFQRQDLDGAIAAWDKALTFDPNHKNAQLQRAQAIELKQNLQKLR
jgi:Tfp pilus assembly protein PilF